MRSGSSTVRGYPGSPPSDSARVELDSQAVGRLWWVGSMPFAVFEATNVQSEVARFLRRYGPGLHSLSWTVEDLWTVENLLRRGDVRITGTDIPGRHFFMHPKDSGSVLVEWTDYYLNDDPRDGAVLSRACAPVVDVVDVAWITAVVRDTEAAAVTLGRLIDLDVVTGNPCGPRDQEDTLDLLIADMTLRLVAPRSDRSRYAAALDRHGERLASVCLGVADLGKAKMALASAAIDVIETTSVSVWTDPGATLGLTLEWADEYVSTRLRATHSSRPS
jgi:hypothetical protein